MSNDFTEKLEACREKSSFDDLDKSEKLQGLQIICKGFIEDTDDWNWKTNLIDISNLYSQTCDDVRQSVALNRIIMCYVMRSSMRDEYHEHLYHCISLLSKDPGCTLKHTEEIDRFLDWYIPKHHPEVTS